jgi:hypothetical protein
MQVVEEDMHGVELVSVLGVNDRMCKNATSFIRNQFQRDAFRP